jgi:hypothetical protein
VYSNFVILVLILILVISFSIVLKFATDPVVKHFNIYTSNEKINFIERKQMEKMQNVYFSIFNYLKTNNIEAIKRVCTESFIKEYLHKLYIVERPLSILQNNMLEISKDLIHIEIIGRSINNKITKNILIFKRILLKLLDKKNDINSSTPEIQEIFLLHEIN